MLRHNNRQHPEGFTEFEAVYNAHYSRILRYSIRRCSDVQVAEDITSATFMKAMMHFHEFEDRGKPVVAWLYRIASNELASYYRKKDNTYTVSLDDELLHVDIAWTNDVVEEAIQNQEALERDLLFKTTLRKIKSMPPKYREVLLLHYVERLKIADIATVMNCRVGTVKSLLSRGRKILRTDLQPYDEIDVIPSVATHTAIQSTNHEKVT